MQIDLPYFNGFRIDLESEILYLHLAGFANGSDDLSCYTSFSNADEVYDVVNNLERITKELKLMLKSSNKEGGFYAS
jgi:hypothetical protein